MTVLKVSLAIPGCHGQAKRTERPMWRGRVVGVVVPAQHALQVTVEGHGHAHGRLGLHGRALQPQQRRVHGPHVERRLKLVGP